MHRLTRWLTTLTFAFAMAACGGGGGGGGGGGAGSGTPPAGLLAGDAASPALAAVVNLPAQPAPDADIANGMILTRLDVVIAADATVGQVNAALGGIGATIAAMRAGTPVLTIAVPRQANTDALAALAATLETQPGFLAALPAPQAVVSRAPPAPANADVDFAYLQRSRFPAAWNARAAAGNCANNKVTVIVADAFHRPIDALYAQFAGQVPGVADLGNGSAAAGGLTGFHGYDVLTTLAATFDATVPTGANPFPDCLEIKAVQIVGLTPYGITAEIEAALAATNGKAVVNGSFGWDSCGVPDGSGVLPPCTLANLNVPRARTRAIWSAIQRASLAPFTDRALVVASAGNEANKPVGAAYVGSGIAGFGSAFNVAATADSAMSFASTAALWEPTPACTVAPCLPSLTATPADVSNIARVLANLGQSSAPRAPNVLIAGSVDNFFLQRSSFSDPGAPVLAVGEGIPTLLGAPTQGTSFSAPQVAALASYLWLLSPDLRARPARDTVALIQATASNGLLIDGVSIADGLINAYASVLSLDEAAPVTPSTARVRLAILDVAGAIDGGGNVVGDGRFDLTDLQAYRALYLDATGAPLEPTTRDHGRFDLNGDGFTGGSRTARVDVDPNGSTRFGAPLLTTLQLTLSNSTLTIDETSATDAQMLCFYAKSGLYSGTDAAARDAILGELCRTSASPQLRHRGLTIERSSDIEVFEPDGSFTNIAPFDDRVRIEDENNSPPFVGNLSSTVQMQTGLTTTGSLTLTAASDIDTVTVDAQSGTVRTITMKGRAACNTNLQNDPNRTRRVLGVNLFSRYDAGRGVVIGPSGATVVISASLAVSPLAQFGSRQASATIGVLNGSTFEQFDIQTTNDALQPAFNRTVVMPAGGTVDVDLDARVACLVAEGGANQNHAAEASFTIGITPN